MAAGLRGFSAVDPDLESGRSRVDPVLQELAEEGVGVGELPHHVGDEASLRSDPRPLFAVRTVGRHPARYDNRRRAFLAKNAVLAKNAFKSPDDFFAGLAGGATEVPRGLAPFRAARSRARGGLPTLARHRPPCAGGRRAPAGPVVPGRWQASPRPTPTCAKNGKPFLGRGGPARQMAGRR
jgi:hypothetical protein